MFKGILNIVAVILWSIVTFVFLVGGSVNVIDGQSTDAVRGYQHLLVAAVGLFTVLTLLDKDDE